MTTQHWALPYMGLPWSPGERGPASFDCWGFVRWVYSKQYGIELPAFVGVDARDHLAVRRQMLQEERQLSTVWSDWTQVETPKEGDAVAMGRFEHLYHVGIFIELLEGGRVLHCKDRIGVLHQTLAQLRSEGMSRILFYRHALYR